MLTLSNGIFIEDFQYNDVTNGKIQIVPPEFDYSGTVVTNSGTVVCPKQIFTMHGPDWSDFDDEIGKPYSGPPSSNDSYIRFPVLNWNQAAGMFLKVVTTGPSVLTFDRAFSGYVGDIFSVMINDIERLTIKGTAGYSWTRNTISLGKGTYVIGFVLATARWQGTGVVREGLAQTTPGFTDLLRYLRLTNVSITNVKNLPQSVYTTAVFPVSSSLTATGTTKVNSGQLNLSSTSWLLYSVHSGPVVFACDSTLSAPNAFIGKFGQMNAVANGNLLGTYTLGTHHASDTGGFSVSAQASLQVVSTGGQQTSALIRPLKRTALVMSRPTLVSGVPVTPLGDCTTEVLTNCTAAQYVRRVDPHAPANTLPVAATWRWLSLDAQSDPLTSQLTQWHATDFSGPVWSTPGDYRPNVGNFSIKIAGQLASVRYPSVQFDAAHLDHLTTTLPRASVSTSGAMTWVFVGAFARFRGALADNCPLIDFDTTKTIDYVPATEFSADRGNYLPWIDDPTAASIYLGLAAYSDKDPTSSRFAYRTDDTGAAFGRSDALVISDATPVVVVYRLSGTTGTVAVTPLVSGHATSTQASFTRTAPASGSRTSFALGKSRIAPPFQGSFLTGSLSLLEVDFYNRAITDAEITKLQNFYLSLYAPVAGGIAEPDYTKGTVDVNNEQILLYASDPETSLVFLSGNRAANLGVFPSTAAGRVEMDRFNQQGVPVVQVSNRDYSTLLNYMVGEV